MRSRFIISLAVVAFVAGALGVATVGAAPGSQPPLNVNVTNTPLAVHMDNTAIAIDDTTPIKVDAAPVRIDATANTVEVTNSSSSALWVRDIGTAQNLPVNLSADVFIADGAWQSDNVQAASASGAEFYVPADKWLVIKTISANGYTAVGESLQHLRLSRKMPENYDDFEELMYIPVTKQGEAQPYGAIIPFDQTRWAGAEQCEIWVKPGSILILHAYKSADEFKAQMRVRLNGMLVDHP